jgi:hypothetical protein
MSKINASIRFVNQENEGVDGLRVDLHGTGFFSGFVGEKITDSSGWVTFELDTSQNYDLWVDNKDFEQEIGVFVKDCSFSFKYHNKDYKNFSSFR